MDADLYDNPTAIFKRIQFCHDLEFECAIPAKIVRVFADHTADAQPLIKLVSDSSAIDQVPIRVTTLWDFHGDFEVHHPLNVGDTGWLIAADRNTDLVKQYNCELDETKNQGAQEPNKDLNLHRYRWGFFIPDRWDRQLRTKQTVPEQLQDCFYVKDRNGNVEVLLDEDGRVAITAKSAVEIFSDLFVHGDSVFDGEALFNDDVHFKQNITVDGEALVSDLRVMHDAKFDHDVTIDGSIYVNGKDSRVNDMTEQEITCVTSVTQDKQTKQTVLTLEKMKVFRTAKDHERDVTITVPDSGGGGETTIYADDISVDFKELDGLKKLEIKHWHDEENVSEDSISKTLQMDLTDPDLVNPDKDAQVVCRDASGNILYKTIGTLVNTVKTDNVSTELVALKEGDEEDKIAIKNWHTPENASATKTIAETLQSDLLSSESSTSSDPDPDREIQVVCRDSDGNVYYKKLGSLVATTSEASDRMAYYVSYYTDESGTVTPTINNCFVYASRTKISCSNMQLSAGFTGSVYVKYINSISSSGEAANSLSIITTEESTSDTQSVYKIYDFANGRVTADYRCAIVIPVYE